MTTVFGQSPYRACWYGATQGSYHPSKVESHLADDMVLRSVLESLKCGHFSATERLIPFLSHASYDLRQYGQQLFAHVCNHDQVLCYSNALPTIADSEEVRRLIIRLSETLSGNALPLLQCLNNEYGDDVEICEHVLLALRQLGSSTTINEVPPDAESINELIEVLQQELPPEHYYYRGRPMFIGDVTKELVAATLVANRENRPISLTRQHWLLSNFTGEHCPVQHGQAVTDSDMDAVFAFAERVASKSWRHGLKYFYGQAV